MKKEIDYAWAAGLWEGEGYAHINYNHKNDRGGRNPKPLIGMSNEDRTLLKHMARVFGGGVYLKRKAGYVNPQGIKLNHDDFQWVISNRKALAAARAMLPYVKGEKRVKLQEICNYYHEKDKRMYRNNRPRRSGKEM